MDDEGLVVFDAEDASKERALRDVSVPIIGGCLEKSERFPFFIEIVGIDCSYGPALFCHGLDIGSLKVELSAAHDSRNYPAGVKTDHLEINKLVGFGPLQRYLAELCPLVNRLPVSHLSNGQAWAILELVGMALVQRCGGK